MKLTTDHTHPVCKCTEITRVVLVSHPVEAEIQVRLCAEADCTPLLSAMETLSAAIGRHIVSESEADWLISHYSNRPPVRVLADITKVLEGGYCRRYYVKRDVLLKCAASPRVKCIACGDRNCDDPGHRDLSEFEQTVERNRKGFVYFAIHQPTKYLKVGFSEKPAKRLQTHRASVPGELTTLGVVPGGRALEQAIHEELNVWLVPGYHEWFFYSHAVREYIDRIIGVYA
jgi:hypothetical protein